MKHALLPSTMASKGLLGLALLAAAASGASQNRETPSTERSRTMQATAAAVKNGTGTLREDLEPLRKRFALPGPPRSVKWLSGRTGDDAVPGPSTYWIDAVLRLTPEQAATLRQQYALQALPAGQRPDVVPGLQPFLPPGSWEGSAALDRGLSQGSWWVKAYVNADSLVLVALGQ